MARRTSLETTASKSKSRFQLCAEDFCESYFVCSYQCHLQEKPSSSNVRTFIATFSKPTKMTPAPPSVVRVNLEVVYEGGGCKVSRFKGAPRPPFPPRRRPRTPPPLRRSRRKQPLPRRRDAVQRALVRPGARPCRLIALTPWGFRFGTARAQVIRRKLALQQLVTLDDAFTETRLPQ